MMCRFLAGALLCLPAAAADADLILHNGKVVTVDAAFRVVEAIAMKSGRITAAGTSADILKSERAPGTRVVDLAEKTVRPA
jgi:predicted amidohydrolase YtcJ